MFVDESAFYLLAHKVRPYTPIGKTPVFSVPLTHDHVSAIGAITPDGHTLSNVLNKSPDVIDFLKQLLRNIPGKLLLIWDGVSIHRSQMIKDFLADGEQHEFIWNTCLPIRQTSIPKKGYGIFSSVVSSKMSVARRSNNLMTHSFLPRRV